MPAQAAPARGWRLLIAPALLLLIGPFALSRTQPHLTMLNSALVIAWPARASIEYACASLGALLLALSLGRRGPALARLAAWMLMLTLAFVGAQRTRLRLTLDAFGIERRELLGSTRVPWAEVTRVETGSVALVVWAGDRQVRVDTDAFAPELRATVERSVARRVREARPQTAADPP